MINSLGILPSCIKALAFINIGYFIFWLFYDWGKYLLPIYLIFRNQCEELRSTLSKRQQDEVCVERLEQLRIKEEIEMEKKEQEAMYAKLWEQDM